MITIFSLPGLTTTISVKTTLYNADENSYCAQCIYIVGLRVIYWQPIRLTRAAMRKTFKTPTKCTVKYLKSPFYKGTILWNQLEAVTKFVEALKPLYVGYQETW